MSLQTCTTTAFQDVGPVARHELRFVSAHHPGRGISVPCDARGHVDLNTLPEGLRNAYLCARAMMGRDYLFPVVQRVH